ncbi:DUF6789 family protein [Halomicrobium urmianum]|uniref:DUF6789 family protein n=1 Tax=Halomicrobium urmianum TaxID=1586233 RepID=UPI001CD9DCD6|nr:DUF6789 family protein [Halomicrobium urmianum]
MDPVRSSLGGGIAATVVLLLFLLVADVLLAGTDLLLFATFRSLCAVGGPPYCELESTTATLLTYVWFGLLFAVAWPLVFGAVTWALPGDSGTVHGMVFALVLWSGHLVVALGSAGLEGGAFADRLPLLIATMVAYLVYGFVLGGGYDSLAEHRTFQVGDRVP